MQLKLKREKHGYNTFRLSVRAEYTAEEKRQLDTHDDLAYHSILYRPTDEYLKDRNRKDGLVPMLFKAVLGNPGGNEIRITAASLEAGHVLEGNMDSVMQAEHEIRENAATLLNRLDTADGFDGHEHVLDLARQELAASARPPREEA